MQTLFRVLPHYKEAACHSVLQTPNGFNRLGLYHITINPHSVIISTSAKNLIQKNIKLWKCTVLY